MSRRWLPFLCERLSNIPKSSYYGSQRPLQRTFWNVKAKDVDKRSPLFICDPIKGTMKIHSIYSMNRNDLTQLFVKNLACLCEFCLDSQWYFCINIPWIGHWVPKVLQPQNTQSLKDTMIEGWEWRLAVWSRRWAFKIKLSYLHLGSICVFSLILI
jgi:hypothetical protein